MLKRLLRFVASQPGPPDSPADLTRARMEAFLRHRSATIGSGPAWGEVRNAGRILAALPPERPVREEVLDFAFQRVEGLVFSVQTGYSDHELRQLIAAARTDVARLRDRIRSGHALAARWRTGDTEMTGRQRTDAEMLARIADTGVVPCLGLDNVSEQAARRELASRLFVTLPDLWPLLILIVALTGRSPEMLKELPASHRVLGDGDAAVELGLVKRRRGAGNWHQRVIWETGPAGREFHAPGGFYLLLHHLMAPGREFSGQNLVWSAWRNGSPTGSGEHVNPFAHSLTLPSKPQAAWRARHGLAGDDGQPLQIDLQRLKTSIEVRRTRQAGGHLPSAARTNTMPVLFRNYLRGDPTVRGWAEDVVSEALADAEQQALTAHRLAMQRAGGGPRVTGDGESASRQAAQPGDVRSAEQHDGPWGACADPQRHPETGRPCRASFLDCFHCGNCLITTDHLPRLISLVSALDSRRLLVGEAEWWQRYGPAWAAIRHDILGRFSPAEVQQARDATPADALLDLVENPWEVP